MTFSKTGRPVLAVAEHVSKRLLGGRTVGWVTTPCGRWGGRHRIAELADFLKFVSGVMIQISNSPLFCFFFQTLV